MTKKQMRRGARPAKKRSKPHPTRHAPKPQSLALVVRDPNGLLPQAQVPVGGLTVTGEPTVNVATIGTLKLRDKQIKALRRPVADDEVEWRPTRRDGAPEIPYVPHNGYRDRLDAAFGIGGWGMAPVGVPKEKDDVVYCPWALVVDGVARFYAWGEQAYDPKNRQMTYGDALEGTKSNAITRCGKELGIARDLWSRRYIAALKRRVPVEERIVGDWPVSSGSRQRERPPATARTGQEDVPISQPQRQRLAIIAKKAGRDPLEVKRYLKAFYGIDSSKALKRNDYEAVCAAVEARGPLQTKGQTNEPAREPDEVLPPMSDADLDWGLRPPGGRR